jgi:anaerobic magnesium-protoporphyrin IX monomethyl ester cyclase
MRKDPKKIMLIQPPQTFVEGKDRKRVVFPLGLAYLGSILKKNGYEVSLLDAVMEGFSEHRKIKDDICEYGLSIDSIRRIMEERSPDVIGISVMTSCFLFSALRICDAAKSVGKGITTVIGGPAVTCDPEAAIGSDSVDFAVLGEGEETLLKLLECVASGNAPEKIDGIAFKKGKKQVINRPVSFIEDIDAIPMPDWELCDIKKYSEVACAHGTFREKPLAPIVTSRGCPFSCAFCFNWKMNGKVYRRRSVDNLIKEIDRLVNRYGVREIHFEDDNLTLDRERAMALCDAMIERRYNLSWMTPNGIAVKTLDEKLLKKMKKAGCYAVALGIESGSQYVIDNIIKKPVLLEKVEEVVRILRDIDISIAAYFIIGLPGETKAQIEDTVNFASRLRAINPNLYSTFSIFMPFKGTELYDISARNGYIKCPIDYLRVRICCANIETPEFDRHYIEEMRRTAWQRANGIDSERDLVGKRGGFIPKTV